MKKPSWWDELSGFQKTVGAGLALIALGIPMGQAMDRGRITAVTEQLQAMQATQVAFAADEDAFRQTVLNEVGQNSEARERYNCWREERSNGVNNDLAYERCYGMTIQQVRGRTWR